MMPKKKKKPKTRNLHAISAQFRQAGSMKSKEEKRTQNKELDLIQEEIEEYEEEKKQQDCSRYDGYEIETEEPGPSNNMTYTNIDETN